MKSHTEYLTFHTRENREYGFWGGESEEDRAMAGYRVDMPVGRVARYPRGKRRFFSR